MDYVKKILVAFSFLLTTSTAFGQAETQPEDQQLKRNEGSIKDQFDYVISKSYTYKGNGKVYKNVQRHWLTELQANTLDSLNVLEKSLADSNATIATQTTEIDNLKAELTQTKTTLSNSNAEKDMISLFGASMSKTSYNLILWSIIGGLTLLLLVFIVRFKGSNSATKEAKRKLEEVETEFEDHRRVALEREQKVRRQLQDEINKNKAKAK